MSMRNFIGLAAACAALSFAMPAFAAEPSSLRCVGTELGDDFALAQVDRIATALIGGAEEIPTVPSEPLDNAVSACAKRNGWSEDARSMSRMLTLVSILRPAIERTLRAENVDTAKLQQIYADLPESARRGFIDPDKMQAASQIVAKRLSASGINTSGKRAEHIGMYYGALAAGEFITPAFAAA